ncbi:hypothetical protein [Moritella sp. F3]|uniref:hypothetical protein n=1 Tax=Moritella sp. F3 TaxID=2718882 RepID=UPI001A1B1370|nr:hypothetical protein [Moritella sp. F3]GIC75754.1 hypothetical protein FMO001_04810 [Moritella sp. F1]GIC81798.1 hypothetical protein FMO003_20790 [Moritella sp. F3]
MMKYIKGQFFTVLQGVLLSTALSVSSFQAMAVESKMATVFPDEQVQPMFKNAYTEMSRRYTLFAELFNLCQQKPNAEDCQKPYEQAKQNYTVASSIYNSIEMTLMPAFIELETPLMSLVELNKALTKLGYMDTELADEQISTTALIPYINQWQVKNNLPVTDKIYLLHTYLISADAMQAMPEQQHKLQHKQPS